MGEVEPQSWAFDELGRAVTDVQYATDVDAIRTERARPSGGGREEVEDKRGGPGGA